MKLILINIRFQTPNPSEDYINSIKGIIIKNPKHIPNIGHRYVFKDGTNTVIKDVCWSSLCKTVFAFYEEII